jgi:hypothetical protein
MANTFKFGNGQWAVGKETALAYNDENSNFKPLPFSFDRGSIATVVNKNGLIETVGVDEPRIDFLNNTKGHLLLEPSRRNDVTYSEDLSEWTTTDLSITSNSEVSPDGTQNADKVTATANFARIQYTYTLSASTTYTISFYVKNISAVNPRVQVYDNTNATNLLNTYYGSELTGKWKRLTYSFTTTTGTSILVRPIRDINDTEEMYIWGIQLEQGSYATSYIPTSGSAVTRSAETNYQQNVTQVIGQSEGTMYIEFVPKDTSATQILYQVRSSSGTIGQIDIRLTGGNISTLANDGGSSQFSMGSTSYSAGTKYKVAVRYKLNDSKIYINGSSVGSDTSCSFTGSSLDQISFAENLTSLVPVADILDARLYNTALSDSELQALTS